jgi:hypothetical protein
MLHAIASTSAARAFAPHASTSSSFNARARSRALSPRASSTPLRAPVTRAVAVPALARVAHASTRALAARRARVRAHASEKSAGLSAGAVASAALSATLACAYAALVYFAGCNAFMWALDISAPIIEQPLPYVLGRLFVAIGMTTLAGLNFYPQARKQLGLCLRCATSSESDAATKQFAGIFAAKVVGKIVLEFVAYWYALTTFTPCTVSMELCAYYAVAFVGHAAFMASSGRVLGASGSTETIPQNVRVLIGSFDLVLAALCVATSRLALAGWGVASAACGTAFLALALYFTFENKQKPQVAST